jgi:hypothetical protein
MAPINKGKRIINKYLYTGAREGGWFQKHSEVRPQGGQVYNYKALQRVAGEPAVLQTSLPTGSQSYEIIFIMRLPTIKILVFSV